MGYGTTVIVIDLAKLEREAWVLAGFEPADHGEQERLADERKRLGFNPCEKSQELTACKDPHATRSAKRALNSLTGGDVERERECWSKTSLHQLRQRGADNGLADYLNEVETRLAALLGHIPHR